MSPVERGEDETRARYTAADGGGDAATAGGPDETTTGAVTRCRQGSTRDAIDIGWGRRKWKDYAYAATAMPIVNNYYKLCE